MSSMNICVMVNFMLQLDWAMGCTDSWLGTISGWVQVGFFFWKRLAFEWVSSWPSPMCMGIIQSVKDLHRIKVEKG